MYDHNTLRSCFVIYTQRIITKSIKMRTRDVERVLFRHNNRRLTCCDNRMRSNVLTHVCTGTTIVSVGIAFFFSPPFSMHLNIMCLCLFFYNPTTGVCEPHGAGYVSIKLHIRTSRRRKSHDEIQWRNFVTLWNRNCSVRMASGSIRTYAQ